MAGTMPSLQEKNLVKILQSVRELFQGRSNAVGEVTLTANAASTTVTAPNIGAGTKPQLTPKTANAAAALATTYVSAVTVGAFTITHANNAQVDKTFLWTGHG